MKIGEVRERIGSMKEEELRRLICEIYKAIPKNVKEEKNIDSFFDLQSNEKEKLPKETKVSNKPQVDMDVLEKEIDEFVSDAYNQLYLAPNRKIPKKERPKWRFKVKGYVKALSQVPPDTLDGRIAAGLLADLYKMTSYACSYYLFNTEDAFASIMISQPEFYHLVVQQYLGGGRGEEEFEILVRLLAPEGLSRENVAKDMYGGFLCETKPSEYELLLQVARKVQEEKLKKIPQKKSYSVSYYAHESAADNITGFITRLYLKMGEPDKAADNLFKYDCEDKSEIKLYKLLIYYISAENSPDEWMRQYEKAVKKGIKPREYLQDIYEKLKNGEKPYDY